MRTSWKRFAVVLAACMTVAGWTACSSTQVGSLTEAGLLAAGEDPEKARQVGQAAGGVSASLAPMDFETERAIGNNVALKSLATQGRLYPNDAVQRYVNLVGRAVARQSPRPFLPWRFAVVENEGVNAWATPGGFIFITTGALRNMEDEAQLAGVLAHEVAHVTRAHMVNILRLQSGVANAAKGFAAASEMKPEELTQLNALTEAGSDILFTKGYGNKSELEADESGVEFSAAAGYDPSALRRFLEKLQEAGASEGGWLTSTHPPLGARINALIRQEAAPAYSGLEGVRVEDRFRQQVAPLLTP